MNTLIHVVGEFAIIFIGACAVFCMIYGIMSLIGDYGPKSVKK